MVISKSDFEAYVHVQMSGMVNMFDVKQVANLCGLTREQCIEIMEGYGQFEKQFGGEKNGNEI